VRGVGIPVIDMFEVVAKESARIGAREVVILGTALTMGSQRFRGAFAKHGVQAAEPDDEATRSMTIQLIGDLQRGKLEGAAERLQAIAETSTDQSRERPVVCLACTELPLAFRELKAMPELEVDGFLYINTTVVHADAAFDFAVE
jgi:aspartate racemase